MTVVEFGDGWPVALMAVMVVIVERMRIGYAENNHHHNTVTSSAVFFAALYVIVAVVCLLFLPPLPINPIYG
jgi:hypothetical protein